MNKQTYNKTYKVNPRYLKDYTGQGLYILTLDKAVYIKTLKHFLKNYSNVTIAKEGKQFIIKARQKGL